MMSQLAFLGLPGGWEWIVIGGALLLLFGRRLPEVSRSIGKSIVEFKRGLADVKDEMNKAGQDDNRIGSSDDHHKALDQSSGSKDHAVNTNH
jgi:sec-independent protein translocase protein TatA